MFRLTFILACLMMCTFTAAGHAQKVSVNVRQGSLEDVFNQLSRQTSVQFVYNPLAAEKVRIEGVRYNKVDMQHVLDGVLAGTGMQYEIVDGIYIIKENAAAGLQQNTAGKVSGRVLDAGGNPLIGAAVVVKGTTRGTATDVNGGFVLENITNPSVTLQITYIGKKSHEITVALNSNTTIKLEDAVESIGQVVVTGYQTISKERAAGSFSTVSAKELEDIRITTVTDLLEGHVAGFSNGTLRGTTSFFAGSQPLYVIDGFPIESARYSATGNLEEALPDLNMDDVESITTLKDAAATSIYGARAANGVVVIMTRKARPNQTNISFTSTFTFTPYEYYTGNLADAGTVIDIERELVSSNPIFNTPANAQDYLDKATYTSQGMKALLNYYAGNISETEMNKALAALAGNGHSYYRDIEKYGKRDAFTQQYNLAVNHGTDKTSTNVSFTYINDRLNDKYSDNQTFGGNITTNVRFTDWLTLDFGTYFNFKKNGAQTYSLTSPTYAYSVYDRLVNADGSRYTVLAEDRRTKADNATIANYGLYSMDVTPLDEIGMNLAKTRDFSNRSYARLNIRFTDYLHYSGSFQYEYDNNKYTRLNDKSSYYVRSLVNGYTENNNGTAKYNIPYGDILESNTSITNSYNFRQQVDFDKTFGGVHNVTALAGFEVRHMKVTYDGVNRYNYDKEMLSYSAVDEERFVGQYFYGLLSGYQYMSNYPYRELVNRYVSFYGNAAYSYDNRYIFTGSLRWDRSNLWGTSSKYQDKPTWSVGGAWNIDREQFFEVPWVNMLKLRVSYGIGGNIARDASPYLVVNYYNNNNVGGAYGTISTQPNPLLSWEKTATFNAGVDFSVLNNRLSGSIDYYRKKGSDLLSNTMGNPTEGFGFSTMKINNGEMTNNGIEVSLTGQVVRKRDFSWDASVNFAYNKNEVTDNTATAPVYYLQLDYGNAYPRIGDPYNALYGYKWAGLNEDGIPQIYDSEGNKTSYTPSDLESIVYLGSKNPVYTGSLNLNFSYKNLSLSCMFLYEGGHKVRNTFLPWLSTSYSSSAGGYIPMTNGAINGDIANRWQQKGDENKTNIPRLLVSTADYSLFSEYVYTYADIQALNAGNLRMRNISLSYRIPEAVSRKLAMQNARVHFSIENLFMIADSKEAKYMLNGYIKPSYVLGLNLNF